MNRNLRSALFGASVLVIGATSACSSPELADSAPPPSAYVEAPQSAPSAAPQGRVETTELLGGPPPAAPAYRAPPAANLPAGYGVMAPIPNPKATKPVRRVRQPDRPAVSTTARPAAIASPAGPVSVRPVTPAPKPAVKPAAPTVVAAKPAAPAAKPVPVKPAAPAVVAAKPAAPVVAPAAKPAPQVAAKPAVPVVPAKPLTKAQQLGANVAADVTSGAKLDIPAAVTAGQEGVVVLSLPESLLGRVQAEAAKLGLTVPARTVDARALLSGEGYTIIPNASQAARLKAGETTTFAWQVKPAAGAKGPLKADVSGELKGGAKPQAFPITSIEQAVAAPAPAPVAKKPGFDFKGLFAKKGDQAGHKVDEAADAASSAATEGAASAQGFFGKIIDRLTIPSAPKVTVPAFGEVRSGSLVLGAIALGILLLLSALGSRASARRQAAERRRKFRSMADFNSAETHEAPAAEPAPEPVQETHAIHEDQAPESHDDREHKKEPEHA